MNYFQLAIKSGLDEYYEILNKSLDTLTQEELIFRPETHSNIIVFLVWHMAMVEDWLTNEILLNNEKICLLTNFNKKLDEEVEERTQILNSKIQELAEKNNYYYSCDLCDKPININNLIKKTYTVARI